MVWLTPRAHCVVLRQSSLPGSFGIAVVRASAVDALAQDELSASAWYHGCGLLPIGE